MTPAQITQALQLHFLTNPNEDSQAFYQELITNIPHSDSISSFKIGIDTNEDLGEPESNITIITFSGPYIEQEIIDYLQSQYEEDIISIRFISNQLIIAFDY